MKEIKMDLVKDEGLLCYKEREGDFLLDKEGKIISNFIEEKQLFSFSELPMYLASFDESSVTLFKRVDIDYIRLTVEFKPIENLTIDEANAYIKAVQNDENVDITKITKIIHKFLINYLSHFS